MEQGVEQGDKTCFKNGTAVLLPVKKTANSLPWYKCLAIKAKVHSSPSSMRFGLISCGILEIKQARKRIIIWVTGFFINSGMRTVVEFNYL
jgi:hypothetical protein